MTKKQQLGANLNNVRMYPECSSKCEHAVLKSVADEDECPVGLF